MFEFVDLFAKYDNNVSVGDKVLRQEQMASIEQNNLVSSSAYSASEIAVTNFTRLAHG